MTLDCRLWIADGRLMRAVAAAALCVLCAVPLAPAKNIDLSTVPKRDTVQLTIYNSEDLTLVRETRKLSFKEGVNPLQFSWANTLIDPTSVELRFLSDPDKLEVLDTAFPHDKAQMLYWNVQSELDGEATVEITYFTSGISWSSDYVCIANADETHMKLTNFVRVYNNSGEEYEDAQVRLVVGKVNLVEKIAQLAQLPMSRLNELGDKARHDFKLDAVKKLAVEYGNERNNGRSYSRSASAARPKEVIKEGLSEYFIFTIEGTETINNGWSKRMVSLKANEVPFKIQYRYREPEYGHQLVRLYLLENDEESELGTTPMPDGTWRVFLDNGEQGLSFLVARHLKYVPIGDKIEVNLGPDPDVIFELVKEKVWRDNIWMHLRGANVYRRVDDGKVKIEVNSSVAGWDEHTIYNQRIRNYTAKDIDAEIRRPFGGHVDFLSQLGAKNHDYYTVQFGKTVKAWESVGLRYEIVQHLGHNAKQNNVTVKKAEVGR